MVYSLLKALVQIVSQDQEFGGSYTGDGGNVPPWVRDLTSTGRSNTDSDNFLIASNDGSDVHTGCISPHRSSTQAIRC